MLKRIKFNKDFVIISLVISLIYITLEWFYFTFVNPQFFYLGFKIDFNLTKYILTKLIFFLAIGLSIHPFKKSKFIYSIYVLVLLLFLIPNLILYSFTNAIAGPVLSICGLLIATGTISTLKINIKTFKINDKFQNILLLAFGILFLIPILTNSGFSINWNTLLLQDIVSTRDQFSSHLMGFTAYAYNWEVKIILPILIVFFLINKRYSLSIFSVLMLLYLYVISGNKVVYVTTIVMIFFYYLNSDYILKIKNFFIICLTGILALYVLDFVMDGYLFRGTFVMRLFFIPALLNYHYFDFFAGKPFFFAESHIFNHFFHSPYADKVGFVISKVYFNATDTYSSNGIISDGYMNLGYIGVVLFILLFASIFLFFNSIEMDSRYFGVFFLFIFLFLSLPMLTVILTNGLWFLILCGFFILKKSEQSKI